MRHTTRRLQALAPAIRPVIVALLACGPKAPENPTESDETLETDNTASSTSPTTGESSSCSNIKLPQGLPPGGEEPYWVWDGDARNVYFIDPRFCGPWDGDCKHDHPPGFVGYVVTLFPEQQAPGVYHVDDETVFGGHRVWIGAMYLADDLCNVSVGVIASDGIVEVLAIDDQCVAIDIREVTTAPAGLDPNGSGRAMTCL